MLVVVRQMGWIVSTHAGNGLSDGRGLYQNMLAVVRQMGWIVSTHTGNGSPDGVDCIKTCWQWFSRWGELYQHMLAVVHQMGWIVSTHAGSGVLNMNYINTSSMVH